MSVKKWGTSVSHGDWFIHSDREGNISRDGIAILFLADIRRELRKLNLLLSCPNFTGIPQTLTQIKRNTAKKRRAKK